VFIVDQTKKTKTSRFVRKSKFILMLLKFKETQWTQLIRSWFMTIPQLYTFVIPVWGSTQWQVRWFTLYGLSTGGIVFVGFLCHYKSYFVQLREMTWWKSPKKSGRSYPIYMSCAVCLVASCAVDRLPLAILIIH